MSRDDLDPRLARVQLVAFDFDGVFTDNSVYVDDEGHETVRCNRSDGIGLSRLREAGVQTVVISTEVNPVVSARCEKLRIPCRQGCEEKRAVLAEILESHGLSFGDAAYVGNDINDLPCLTRVGFAVVVRDAHPEVLPHADYRTEAQGGYGAVREVCDRIVAAKAGGREA